MIALAISAILTLSLPLADNPGYAEQKTPLSC
jgi:hypothetical protein